MKAKFNAALIGLDERSRIRQQAEFMPKSALDTKTRVCLRATGQKLGK
jgi:hypothetical protein